LLREERIDLIVHDRTGVRVSSNLREQGNGSKSEAELTRYFCSSLPRSAACGWTARVGISLRKRLRIQAFSPVAPVSPFSETGARSTRPSAYPPDKSTPGVIRGRKTRGLTWSRTWLR
jgi:hypothetical protein